MILQAIVIDDEPLAHEVINSYVSDIDFIQVIGHFHLATQAITFLNEHKVDLIFLDIQMPKLKGTEFLRSMTHKPAVIITTAYEEYALESFELDVLDYLLKPFRFDRFLKAVNKVYGQHKLKLSNTSEKQDIEGEKQPERQESILIKVDKKHLPIQLEAVCFFESYGNYVKVWMEESYHLTPRTLSSFEEQLDIDQFIRIHKSYLVNKLAIQYWEGNRLILKDGKELPIGKSFKSGLKNSL